LQVNFSPGLAVVLLNGVQQCLRLEECECAHVCTHVCLCVSVRVWLCAVASLYMSRSYSSAFDLYNVYACVYACVSVHVCNRKLIRFMCPGLTAVPLTWTMCVHVCLCMCATASLYVLCVQVLQQFLWLKEYECARVCVFMWVWVCAIAKYSHYCTCINLWYIRSLTTDH
jgi:hypothetical protein